MKNLSVLLAGTALPQSLAVSTLEAMKKLKRDSSNRTRRLNAGSRGVEVLKLNPWIATQSVVSFAMVLLVIGCGNPHAPAPEQPRPAGDPSHVAPVTSYDGGMHEGNLSTEQLIAKAESNLQRLPRKLPTVQRDAAARASNLLAQAKAAIKDDNFDLAHNLAAKAYSLSKELAAGGE